MLIFGVLSAVASLCMDIEQVDEPTLLYFNFSVETPFEGYPVYSGLVLER